MKTNSEQPAFPTQGNAASGELDGGLTKREYFAAAALQGLLASICSDKEIAILYQQTATKKGLNMTTYLNEVAILHADELLKQLESK